MDAAVLALGDLAPDGLAVVNLAAISAEIEPTRVGILGDDAVGGADEARFIELMVPWHGKFEHVDIIAFEHILEHGAVVDETRRQRL